MQNMLINMVQLNATTPNSNAAMNGVDLEELEVISPLIALVFLEKISSKSDSGTSAKACMRNNAAITT